MKEYETGKNKNRALLPTVKTRKTWDIDNNV